MTFVQCKNCNRDLTYSNGAIDHCLVLSDRHFGPGPEEATIDIYIFPILEQPYYFCGFGCLNDWLS
jgi:hypothetical protein